MQLRPGETRKVRLIPLSGARIIHGFRGETEGAV
jgi:urease subunit beta